MLAMIYYIVYNNEELCDWYDENFKNILVKFLYIITYCGHSLEILVEE